MADPHISPPDISGNPVYQFSKGPPKAYVYVIAAGEEAVKVGRARDPKQRLRELQTSHYQRLSIVHVRGFSEVEAAALERRAHQVLAEYRMTGEWFKVKPQTALEAIEAAIETISREGIQPRNIPGNCERVDGKPSGKMIFDYELQRILNDKKHKTMDFRFDESVSDEEFFDRYASMFEQGFGLTRKAASIVRVILLKVEADKSLTHADLSLAEVRSKGIKIGREQFEQALSELCRHKLIAVTSERSVFALNRKYFRGQHVITFVKVYDLAEELAA